MQLVLRVWLCPHPQVTGPSLGVQRESQDERTELHVREGLCGSRSCRPCAWAGRGGGRGEEGNLTFTSLTPEASL